MVRVTRSRLLTAAAGAALLIAGGVAAQPYDPPYPPQQGDPQYGQPQNAPPYGQQPDDQQPGQPPYDPQAGQAPPYDQGQYAPDPNGDQVSVDYAPPPLPVYDQPPPPGPDYLWQPGYWTWDDYDGDYYWVPGVWVEAPEVGLLWTPAFWGLEAGAFIFHEGYWGHEVGWYGGVNYGFGYGGHGYEGGEWRDRHFFYNRTVNNVSHVTNITNFYNAPVTRVAAGSHASFNGPGGVEVRPTQRELTVASQPHIAPTVAQRQNMRAALSQPQFRASANKGAPPVAAAVRPGQFQGPGVVAAARAGGAWTPPPPRQPGQPGAGHGRVGQTRPNGPAYASPSQPRPAGQPPVQPHYNAPAYQAPQPRPAGQPPAQPRYGAPGNQTPPAGQPPVQPRPAQQAPRAAPPPRQAQPPKPDEKRPPKPDDNRPPN